MSTDKVRYDIPEDVRDVAARSVHEAREAIDRMMEAARQAVDTARERAASLQTDAGETNERIMSYAHTHVSAALDFAEKLARATSIAEVARLQMEFARTQVETINAQTREIGAAGAKFVAQAMKPPQG